MEQVKLDIQIGRGYKDELIEQEDQEDRLHALMDEIVDLAQCHGFDVSFKKLKSALKPAKLEK